MVRRLVGTIRPLDWIELISDAKESSIFVDGEADEEIFRLPLNPLVHNNQSD